MNINAFSEIAFKSSKKKKFTKQNIITIISLLICFNFLAFYSCKMFFKIYEHKKLKNEYNTLVEQNTLLSKTTTELSKNYANKKTEYGVAQERYNEAIANSPIAYLTFDDGPSDNTLKILDALDKYKVKATFFVVYKEGYDKVYKEIVNRGHVLANHTYSHKYKNIYSSANVFIDDVLKLDKKLEEITGVPPSKILRFPGGSNANFGPSGTLPEIKAKLNDLEYSYYDWNVDSMDALELTQSKNIIVDSVLEGTDNVNTANVLMHDMNIKHTTIDALPEIIEGLKDRGYRFKTLDQDSVKIQF